MADRTDRELLELAARAIGEKLVHFDGDSAFLQGVQAPWRPHDDDGDAFRLAVTLSLEVGSHKALGYSVASAIVAGTPGVIRFEEYHGTDPYAATRRAIVRAAAAIGEKAA